jgi:hypothetical protein
MKSTKTKHSQDTVTIPVPVTPAQIAALLTLTGALKDSDVERVAARMFSLGLFAVGLDHSGDAGLASITDALYGKDSDDSAGVFDAIVSAGDNAWCTWINAERLRRAQAIGTAEATS